MSTIENRINDLKENGFKLDFGETFSEAFRIYQKVFAYGALAFLLYFIFAWIFNQVTALLPYMDQGLMQIQETLQDNPGDMMALEDAMRTYISSPLVVIISLLSTLLYALVFPLIAGIVYMAYRYDKDGSLDVSYLFEGYNGKKFGRLIVLYIYYTLAKIVGLLIIGFGFFIPFVGFAIASCFIMINDMKTMDAIKASFTITFKKFFVVLLLLLLSYAYGIVGVFACFFGILFTLPLTTVMCYTIYKQSVGIDFDEELESIGK